MKSQDKLKLIILHGWGQEKSQWSIFADKIGQTISTEVFDLPGFGKEPINKNVKTVKEYAQWTTKLIENKRGNHKVILMGHSFGGRIAAEIAVNNPSWLKSLILIAAPCIRIPSLKNQILGSLAKIASSVIPESKLKDKIIIKFGSEDYIRARNTELEEIFRAAIGYDQSHQLGKINIPTSLVWGESDTEVPVSIAKKMLTLIPDCKLTILPDTGHNIHLENPDLLYGKVRNLIQEQN
ncbi:alpha/beta fold hydrolase [Candidatus Dojkabacteria bacterium]|nr:alpha/beta fold hydrolase [Candidatus Dojkabacteria bacterium]